VADTLPEIDLDTAKEIYTDFGFTVYRAQCLEMDAGNLLVTFIGVAGKIENPEMVDALYRSIDRDTFGQLLKVIKKTVDFSEDSMKHIDDALKNRNFLIHHFFRKHAIDMLSEKERSGMKKELEAIKRSFNIAEAIIKTISLALLKTLGISEEQLDTMIEKEILKKLDT